MKNILNHTVHDHDVHNELSVGSIVGHKPEALGAVVNVHALVELLVQHLTTPQARVVPTYTDTYIQNYNTHT